MSNDEFTSKVEMKNFAYEERIGLGEETVKNCVADFLRGRGYAVAVGKKREHGPDIRATKDGLNLVVEAKGEGSRNEMFNNFFVSILGQILQRMTEQAAEYGIALPAHRKFARLIEELSDTPRFVLRLNFYLVRPSSDGHHEVGLLKWNVK
ncbi:MAG TPA: hypothetical protein VGT03_04880 [Candidatus Acidoferrales bacterium]|nr:hypothetical protein [Candidatus Acidoferrales bacterium]